MSGDFVLHWLPSATQSQVKKTLFLCFIFRRPHELLFSGLLQFPPQLRAAEPEGGLALEVHKIISGSKYTVIYGFYSDNRFLFRELMRAASPTAESERGGQPCGCWLWESNGFSVGLFNLSWVGSHLSARVVNSSITFKCTGNHSVFIKAAQLKLWYLMQENYFSSFLFIWSEDSQRHW